MFWIAPKISGPKQFFFVFSEFQNESHNESPSLTTIHYQTSSCCVSENQGRRHEQFEGVQDCTPHSGLEGAPNVFFSFFNSKSVVRWYETTAFWYFVERFVWPKKWRHLLRSWLDDSLTFLIQLGPVWKMFGRCRIVGILHGAAPGECKCLLLLIGSSSSNTNCPTGKPCLFRDDLARTNEAWTYKHGICQRWLPNFFSNFL